VALPDTATAAPQPREVQEPLLTPEELQALFPSDLPTSLPAGFASGVEEFFTRLEREADGADEAGAADPDPAADDALAPARPGAYRAAVEVTACYALLLPVELVFSGRIGSFGVHPHPYWLVVLALAAARGLRVGLAAAALGAAFHVVGFVHARQVSDPSLLLAWPVVREPALFVLGALLVGSLRDDLARRYERLWQAYRARRERTGPGAPPPDAADAVGPGREPEAARRSRRWRLRGGRLRRLVR